jgi:hypothetical protein
MVPTQVDFDLLFHIYFERYDAETQGAIRKIMFDQKQKALGLPTSDEISTDSILEKAKFLPGSPFLHQMPGDERPT